MRQKARISHLSNLHLEAGITKIPLWGWRQGYQWFTTIYEHLTIKDTNPREQNSEFKVRKNYSPSSKKHDYSVKYVTLAANPLIGVPNTDFLQY